MMDEDRLRTLLSDAVPEPPETVAHAGPVIGRARRTRRRRTGLAVVGAAAAVAVVVGVTTLSTPDAPAPLGTGPTHKAATLDAYTADPCPGLTSVPFPRGHRYPLRPVTLPTSTETLRICAFSGSQQAVPLDALVTGVPAVIAAAGRLPVADSGHCDDPASPTTQLVAAGPDGTRVIPLDACQAVTVGGRNVRAEAVQGLLLTALGRQRESLGPPERVAAPVPRLACALGATPTPASPGRDPLVAASVCLSAHVGRRTVVRALPLTGSDLTRVQRAWAGAVREPTSTAHCQALGSLALAVTTRYGDVARIGDNGCTLTTTATAGPSYRLDLRLSDLFHLYQKKG